jgi:hypothetical protein
MANLSTDKLLLRKNLLAMVCLYSFLGANCSSAQLQTEEITPSILDQISNEAFKMRMSGYFQADVSGNWKGYHVFEVASTNLENWQVILKTAEAVGTIGQMTPIVSQPSPHMELVSENVGYVFAGKDFVGTADGSQNWKRADLSSYFSEPTISKDAYIGEVEIFKNGHGTLSIYEDHPGRGSIALKTLYTCDSGQNWTEKEILCA